MGNMYPPTPPGCRLSCAFGLCSSPYGGAAAVEALCVAVSNLSSGLATSTQAERCYQRLKERETAEIWTWRLRGMTCVSMKMLGLNDFPYWENQEIPTDALIYFRAIETTS